MPTAPDLTAVKAYLGTNVSWSDPEIQSALKAETAAQTRVCRLPADPAEPEPALPYPDDLAEALCRRVAANLALRALPLGLQTSIGEMGATSTRVGGGDAEVRRLERPWRRLVVG